jgi:ankyrin repeat protein
VKADMQDRLLPTFTPLVGYEALAHELVSLGTVDLADAQLAVARAHCFLDWDALAQHARDVNIPGSPIARFERAVEAVITGDIETLDQLLRDDVELVRMRSTRINCFDPPLHRATLLHYVAANGVENHRQRTPANAVEVAEKLLGSGAEVDAIADFYGGPYTTMCLLVSSSGPAEAGVQVPLVELLVAHGAKADGDHAQLGTSPLRAALVFGFVDAAETLVRLGAPVHTLVLAAGLGRLDDARVLLATADAESRHAALALAAQLGRVELVRLLLDAGEDPDRYNPPGFHPHATPLHHAASGGHEAVAALLVARGARRDLQDRIWNSDPAGWAEHAGHDALAALLRVD